MHSPDYQYWARLDTWNMTEAALLIDGKDPREHKGNGVAVRNGEPGYETTYKLWDTFHRTNWKALFGPEAKKAKLPPRWVISVANEKGFDVPQPLLQHLADAPATTELERAQAPRISTADTKERNTMLKLILGFAHAGFGIDLDGTSNPKAKAMRESLERCGLALDDATIKKYLDEARQLHRRTRADGKSAK